MKKLPLFWGLLGLSALMQPAYSPSDFDDSVNVWFKTALVSSNLQGRYHRFDFAGNSLLMYAQNRTSGIYAFTQDRSQLKFLNFNPVIDFSKDASPIWDDLLLPNLTQATIIAVANQAEGYTKYIYTDRQGIASKVGDFASYGSGPRCMVCRCKHRRPLWTIKRSTMHINWL